MRIVTRDVTRRSPIQLIRKFVFGAERSVEAATGSSLQADKALHGSWSELTATPHCCRDDLTPSELIMSIASTFSRPSARRSSLAAEQFRASSASSVSFTESRLQRPRQLFAKAHDVATSISSSGWVAVCSSKQIRLYNVKAANRSREVPTHTSFNIPMRSKDEEIRGIALSNDLLALVTHTRLLVYDEYRSDQGQTRIPVEERKMDRGDSWTPRSLAISQIGTPGNHPGATATIAVGGEREGGVKIFRYRYTAGWNAQHDRLVLRCPWNNGAIKVVGFSPHRTDAIFGPMVYALTTGSRLYCWEIGHNSRVGPGNWVDPSWHIDCNSSSNERVSNLRWISVPI